MYLGTGAPKKGAATTQGKQKTSQTVLLNSHHARSSMKEHRADALALGAEEGRDKLRKATGRSTYPLIRGCPNGETHMR